MALLGAAGFVQGGNIFETLTPKSVEYPRSPKRREELVTVRGWYGNIERLCLFRSSDVRYWCGDIITGVSLTYHGTNAVPSISRHGEPLSTARGNPVAISS